MARPRVHPSVLTPQQRRILDALSAGGGDWIAIADLQAATNVASANVLKVQIHALRKKLHGPRIESGIGLGYRLPRQAEAA